MPVSPRCQGQRSRSGEAVYGSEADTIDGTSGHRRTMGRQGQSRENSRGFANSEKSGEGVLEREMRGHRRHPLRRFLVLVGEKYCRDRSVSLSDHP
jgi:hypothetical protein